MPPDWLGKLRDLPALLTGTCTMAMPRPLSLHASHGTVLPLYDAVTPLTAIRLAPEGKSDWTWDTESYVSVMTKDPKAEFVLAAGLIEMSPDLSTLHETASTTPFVELNPKTAAY